MTDISENDIHVVRKWLDGGCPSWGVPVDQIRKLCSALSDLEDELAALRESREQQAVAWGLFYRGKIVAVSLHEHYRYTVPLYTHPSEQAVTEALKAALETMNRYCRAGHGDDVFMDDLCRSIRKAESALKAAMEVGR